MQVDGIPILALLLIFHNARTKFASMGNIKKFQILILLIINLLILDIINWYLLSVSYSYSATLLWIVDIFYFLLTETVAFFWFLYVYYQINNNILSTQHKQLLKLLLIPLIIVCVIIVLSPWNHAIFYINSQDGSYHRGTFHLLQVACGFGFMILASILAYMKSKKVELFEQKSEYRFLAFITILPFVGGALQIMNYNFIFLWPFTAAAAFLMYTNFQRHQISIDALTSLNNRGKLEQYLHSKIQNHQYGWYFMIIDIDHFKMINDKYGHIEGDRALQVIANTLKMIFGATPTFISRYGGDEFALVSEVDSLSELEALIQHCRNQLSLNARNLKLPYDIGFSIGYAQFENPEKTPINKIMQLADQRMYKQKQLHKKQL